MPSLESIYAEFSVPVSRLCRRMFARRESACLGCRTGNGCAYFSGCETLACVKERGHGFCSECADFPCTKLQPMADGAAFYPHNLKVHNLCVLKARGPEALLAEAPGIRRRYYAGKFKIGAGPTEG